MAESNQRKLSGKRIAFLSADGVEQAELLQPRQALIEAGAQVDVVSPNDKHIQGYNGDNLGDLIPVDVPLGSARPEDYDAIVLPGGVANPDKLRINGQAMDFLRHFYNNNKPIGAICHGPWSLVEIGMVRGRTLTSWPSLQTDIKNAGGNWIDQEVVTDNGLVTSRKPADIPAFNRKLIEEIAEGFHDQHGTREDTQRERREMGIQSGLTDAAQMPADALKS